MNYIRDERGSVTILIMLIAAVLITVGLGFNWLVKEHISSSDGLKNKAEAIIKARSAYDTIIFLILNGRLLPKEVALAGGEEIIGQKTLPLNGLELKLADDLTVRIQESNGVLSIRNLDTINRNALERLLKRDLKDRENASAPMESLLDWIDEDKLARTNGAEESYYQGRGLPYLPRNYALQYLDELEFVRGFDEELFNKLQAQLTLLPSTGFNPNTAGDEVLMAYLDVNEESLSMLKEYLSKKPISSDNELFTLTGKRIARDEDSVYFRPSPFMDITINVGKPRNIYSIRAGLLILQKVNAPYSILSWKEE